MNQNPHRPRRLPPIALLLILLAASAQAQQQQRRLTGDLPETPASATPIAADAALPPPTSPFADTTATAPADASASRGEIGDTTRALLRMQAEGTYAGRSLPILGDQASRSYERYLGSFEHPIPERFELMVPESRGR